MSLLSDKWAHNTFVSETKHVSGFPEDIPDIVVDGGAEQGDFLYIDHVRSSHIRYVPSGEGMGTEILRFFRTGRLEKGLLRSGDIILEMQGQSMAGLRKRDFQRLLRTVDLHAIITLKCVPGRFLSRSLSPVLSEDYCPGSVNHVLQSAILENLMRLTPPVTTRPPVETDGDYRFLEEDEFFQLKETGSLLHYRSHEGYFYGVLKPQANVGDGPFFGHGVALPPLKPAKWDFGLVNAFNLLQPEGPSQTSMESAQSTNRTGHLTKRNVLVS